MHVHFSSIELCEFVIEAVRQITVDEGFQVTSTSRKILQTAELFLTWAKRPYPASLLQFSYTILTNLVRCFTPGENIQSEKMWTAYHMTRCSKKFHDAWCDFILQSVDMEPSPSFYQYVTHIIFKKVINMHYKKNGMAGSNTVNNPQLTNVEENALRYVAGFVFRKVQQEEQKDTVKSFVSEICGVEADGDYEGQKEESEAWINILDRGGLVHIKNEAYQLFYSMEVEVKKTFTLKSVVINGITAEKVKRNLADNTNILTQWQTLVGDRSGYESYFEHIFDRLVSEFVKVRGFAFAASVVETYKTITHTNLQKKKALRKSIT